MARSTSRRHPRRRPQPTPTPGSPRSSWRRRPRSSFRQRGPGGCRPWSRRRVPPPPPPRGPTGLPALTQTTSPPPAPSACPDDDPFSSPPAPAPQAVSAPPTVGSYTFRQHGTTKVGDGPATDLPASAVRQVRNVMRSDNGDVTYDVVINSFGDTTTTSYAVRQTTGDPSLDGVFITHVVTRRANGTVDEFAPLSGARIIALPAGPGTSWNDVATDPIRSTSMVIQGQITDRGRVNACGTVLDSWTVQVTGNPWEPPRTLNCQ